jgi:hypothetical protein
MPRWMLGIAFVGTAALALAGEWRAAAGFGLGAGLGIVGYFWLHETVEALLAGDHPRVPRAVVGKLVLRYVVMGAAVYLGYRTHAVPVLAIFGGLLIPGAGVLAESLVLLGAGCRTAPGKR